MAIDVYSKQKGKEWRKAYNIIKGEFDGKLGDSEKKAFQNVLDWLANAGTGRADIAELEALTDTIFKENNDRMQDDFKGAVNTFVSILSGLASKSKRDPDTFKNFYAEVKDIVGMPRATPKPVPKLSPAPSPKPSPAPSPKPSPAPKPSPSPTPKPTPKTSPKPAPSPTPAKRDDSSGCGIWIVMTIITLLPFGVFRYWSDIKAWIGGKEPDPATKAFVFAESLNLRGGPEESEGNVMDRLAYGTVVYLQPGGTDEWKVAKVGDMQGYVSAAGITGLENFNLLENVWGDEAARSTVVELRYRDALMRFCHDRNDSDYKLYCLDNKGKNVWRSKSLGGHGTFAFILDNKATGARVAAVYSFDEANLPFCQTLETVSNSGTYIKKVTVNKKGDYRIVYGSYAKKNMQKSLPAPVSYDSGRDMPKPSGNLFESIPVGTSHFKGDMGGYPIRLTITKEAGSNSMIGVYKNVRYGTTMNLKGWTRDDLLGNLSFTGRDKGKAWYFQLTGNYNQVYGKVSGDGKTFNVRLRPE